MDYTEIKTKKAIRFQKEDSLMDDFMREQYPYSSTNKNRKRCLFYQDNCFKAIWDLLVMVLLLFICLVLPLQIAFHVDTYFWCLAYIIIDSMFFVDLIMNFFTTIPENETTKESDDLKKICMDYLSTWFLIDLFSILPMEMMASGKFCSRCHTDDPDQLLEFDCPTVQEQGIEVGQANMAVRIVKIGKWFRVIRMLRMIKLLKLLKNKEQFEKRFTSGLKIHSAVQRLTMILIGIAYYQHLMACLWIILGQEQFFSMHDNEGWFQQEVQGLSHKQIYTLSIYFICATMTAVGYGDMSGSTGLERVFCLFLMLTGVLIFGMVTGSLASIMTNQDSINATYTERLMFLNRLQLQYKLPNDLYAQIKKTLQYDSQMASVGLETFIEQLPFDQRVSVAYIIHKDTFVSHPFFRGLGNRRLLSFIGQRFKPQFFEAGQYLYRHGDFIHSFRVFTEGMAAFVQAHYQNQMFAIIDPDVIQHDQNTAKQAYVLQHCGLEDTIVNHVVLLKEIEERELKGKNLAQHVDTSILSKRNFTVKAIYNIKCLALDMTDIDLIKKDFPSVTAKLIKENIQQTVNILIAMMHMIETFSKPQQMGQLGEFRADARDNRSNEKYLKSLALVRQFIMQFQTNDIQIGWSEDENSQEDEDCEKQPIFGAQNKVRKQPIQHSLKSKMGKALFKLMKPQLPPPVKPDQGGGGHSSLGQLLKYLLELKTYNEFEKDQATDDKKQKQRHINIQVHEQPVSPLFAKIIENFRCKLHDVQEMQQLIKLAILRKYDIVKNVLAERNFVLTLDIETEKERKIDKIKEMNKQLLENFGKSIDHLTTKFDKRLKSLQQDLREVQ